MTAALTTLRGTLATALTNAGVWSIASWPVPTPIADLVVVDADDPYLTVSNGVPDLLGPLAHFKIRGYVAALDNQGSLTAIETMIIAIWGKLAASALTIQSDKTVRLGSFTSPSGELTVCEFPIAILTTWS